MIIRQNAVLNGANAETKVIAKTRCVAIGCKMDIMK